MNWLELWGLQIQIWIWDSGKKKLTAEREQYTLPSLLLVVTSSTSFPQHHLSSQISRMIFVENKLSCGETSPVHTDFEQFMEFYRSLCRFCSKSMWRKICAEKISVEKKWQIWGLQGWRASEQSSGVMLRAFGRPTKIIWKSESFQLCRLIKKSWFCRIKSCHQTVCLICHLSERCSKNNGICVSHVMLFV